MVNLTLWSLFPRKRTRYPLNRRIFGALESVGRFGEKPPFPVEIRTPDFLAGVLSCIARTVILHKVIRGGFMQSVCWLLVVHEKVGNPWCSDILGSRLKRKIFFGTVGCSLAASCLSDTIEVHKPFQGLLEACVFVRHHRQNIDHHHYQGLDLFLLHRRIILQRLFASSVGSRMIQNEICANMCVDVFVYYMPLCVGAMCVDVCNNLETAVLLSALILW